MELVEDKAAPEPIPIDPAQYWRFRTLLLEHQKLCERLQAQIAESKHGVDAMGAEVGLDPSRRYRLNDDTLTAVPE